MKSLATLSLLCLANTVCAQYQLVRKYSGSTFFQGWSFYGNYDNLTNGDVWYLDQTNATSQNLAYVNSAGNAIIKVDNTTNVPYNQKRNSIRITTQDAFPVGTVILFDAVHLPYGCSVWPSFWTEGANWPQGGEIDIFEMVNLMTNNQMALHTLPGCMKTTGSVQSGTDGSLNCSTGAGCIVAEASSNSAGSSFAQAGGGVWATQFDASGVFIWFWSRPNIPSNVQQAISSSSLDVSSWGSPSASYPSTSCNMSQFFTAQQLVLDVTLCGDWAGVPSVYNATCLNTGSTGICYNDNVIGAGSPHYDNAYFEVSYVAVFAQTSEASSVSASLNTKTLSSSSSTSSSSKPTSSTGAGTRLSWSLTLAYGALIASVLL